MGNWFLNWFLNFLSLTLLASRPCCLWTWNVGTRRGPHITVKSRPTVNRHRSEVMFRHQILEPLTNFWNAPKHVSYVTPGQPMSKKCRTRFQTTKNATLFQKISAESFSDAIHGSGLPRQGQHAIVDRCRSECPYSWASKHTKSDPLADQRGKKWGTTPIACKNWSSGQKSLLKCEHREISTVQVRGRVLMIFWYMLFFRCFLSFGAVLQKVWQSQCTSSPHQVKFRQCCSPAAKPLL